MKNKNLIKYVTDLGGKAIKKNNKIIVEIDEMYVPQLIKKFNEYEKKKSINYTYVVIILITAISLFFIVNYLFDLKIVNDRFF